MKKLFITTIAICLLSGINMKAQVPDPDQGLRASWMRGAWGVLWLPETTYNGRIEGVSIEPFIDQIKDLQTLDYVQIGLTSPNIYSPSHMAPHPIIESLWEGDTDDNGDPINLCCPRVSVDDPFLSFLEAINDAGLKVEVYVNSYNLLARTPLSIPADFPDVSQRWEDYCDSHFQTFINSKSYHTNGMERRPYMFCYAEYILKTFAVRYGNLIHAWCFDSADNIMEGECGDNPDSEDLDDLRIYQAFADACHAGNPDAAIAFNNSVGDRVLNPFSTATYFDDYTFGHPFGGAGDMTEPIELYIYNYHLIEWMRDYEGYAFLDDDRDWNDKVVSHFFPKQSTTSWNSGATPCLTNDEFVEWTATGIIDGGGITWGTALWYVNLANPGYNLTLRDYALEQLELVDAYLLENQPEPDPDPDGTNLALSGTASQSSTAYSGVASRAIDGNTSGLWADGSVTHTANSANPWWQVDLGADKTIGDINIFGRTDACCIARLSNFTVRVINSSNVTTFTKTYTTYPNPSVSMNAGNVQGKIIKVTLNATNALSLAEVQVFQGDAATLLHIEAEDYTDMYGIQTQATTDEGGGLNVGWINAGDYMDYSVNIPVAGTYYVDYRVASKLGGGSIQFKVGTSTKATTSVASTGGWQVWTTLTTSVSLSAGTQTVRLYAAAAGWNINWFDIYTSGAKSAKVEIQEISNNTMRVYPNPVSDQFIIEMSGAQEATYSIVNYVGQILLSGEINEGYASINISGLASGLYMVRVNDGQESHIKKIMKK